MNSNQMGYHKKRNYKWKNNYKGNYFENNGYNHVINKSEAKNEIIDEENSISNIISKINSEMSFLINDQMQKVFNHPNNPVFEKFIGVAKKIKSLLNLKEFDYNSIVNIIGNIAKETRNAIEILNKVIYYFEILKNFLHYRNFDLRGYINRSFSPSTFNIVNQEYIRDILQYKVIETNKPISLEKFNKDNEDLRRPIDLEKNEHYRYLPLDCVDNKIFCRKLKEILENYKINFDNLKNEYNQDPYTELELCIKMKCIFSHNREEIIYHPLNYKTSLCFSQNVCQNKKRCTLAHNEKELILLFNLNNFSSIIEEINCLIDPNNNVHGLLYNHFLNNSLNETLSDDLLFIKTTACKSQLLCNDFKLCYNYHNLLEKRRDPTKFINLDNTICEQVFINKKWLDPSKCPKGDKCCKYHTKNELMYDYRNFRKLFECEYEKANKLCPYYTYCYYKHAQDLNIKELYLSEEDKSSLFYSLKKLNKMKESYENIKLIAKKIYSCLFCKEIIKNREVFLNCQHYFCEYCFEKLIKDYNCHCQICKFKFKEEATDLFTIGRLCTEKEIEKIDKKKDLNRDLSSIEELKDLVELEKDNLEIFNDDLKNLFKIQINK